MEIIHSHSDPTKLPFILLFYFLTIQSSDQNSTDIHWNFPVEMNESFVFLLESEYRHTLTVIPMKSDNRFSFEQKKTVPSCYLLFHINILCTFSFTHNWISGCFVSARFQFPFCIFNVLSHQLFYYDYLFQFSFGLSLLQLVEYNYLVYYSNVIHLNKVIRNPFEQKCARSNYMVD